MANESEIILKVGLDEEKVPVKIDWTAQDGGVDKPKDAKAFMLSIWDTNESTALRIDLWTKKMMVDEMNDFFFQTYMTMADTYMRATQFEEIANEMREFAKGLKTKMEAQMQKKEQL
jgi:gliding motility-associated protein GldC